MPAKTINRARIFKRDNYTCVYCGSSSIQTGVVLHADHLMPLVSGGKNTASNMVTACGPCNLQKKDSYLSPSDYGQLRGIIANRNIGANINQDDEVSGVRTKNNGVKPARGYSVRLEENEVKFCEEVSGTVGGWIKQAVKAAMLQALRDSRTKRKEAIRIEHEKTEAFQISKVRQQGKEDEKLLERETELEDNLLLTHEKSAAIVTAKIVAEETKKAKAEHQEEMRLRSMSAFQKKKQFELSKAHEQNLKAEEEIYKRKTVASFDPDEYVVESPY